MTKSPDPIASIRRLNLIGFTTVALALGGVGGWAATTHIAGAVIAPGTIVVETNVKKVQHNTGGIVGEIFVREGGHVEGGQVVVRLDPTLPRATLGIVQSQLDVFQAREARLTAERDQTPDVTFSAALLARRSDPTVETAILGETTLFEARRTARANQRSQLRERIAQIENEIKGLGAQQEAKEKEIKFIGEELAGVQGLYTKNLVTIVRYNALQRDQARLQGERGQLIAEVSRARGRIAETEIQIIQLDQDFRTEVLRDLREAQSKIAELQERVNAAEDELKRIDIRAPLTGTVHQLAVHTVGGVVQRGETLMLIVPQSDTLIIEAKVSPTDVDQVHVGSLVHIRVAAGNRRTMQDIEGRVVTVSADQTREQVPGQPVQATYYLVRVTISPDQKHKLGNLSLLAGMQTEVYIRTENRTPLDYLIKPLTEQFARTFRER